VSSVCVYESLKRCNSYRKTRNSSTAGKAVSMLNELSVSKSNDAPQRAAIKCVSGDQSLNVM